MFVEVAFVNRRVDLSNVLVLLLIEFKRLITDLVEQLGVKMEADGQIQFLLPLCSSSRQVLETAELSQPRVE